MENILILIHTEPDGSLSKHAFEAVSAGVLLKSQLADSHLSLGIVGFNASEAAKSFNPGDLESIYAAGGEELKYSRYATDSKAIETLLKTVNPTIVIAPATPRWNKVVAGAAARVNGYTDTHINGIIANNGTIKATRWYYRQRIEVTFSRTQRPWVLLIESGIYQPYAPVTGNPAVREVAVEITDEMKKTTYVGVQEPPAGKNTIRPDAKLLFVAGAGWTKKQADGQVHLKEAEEIILEFLNLTRASLGSSKSLVDLGSEGQPVLSFLTHMNQIGQTGATPRHPKGLSTCCHGEEPHTVGWRFINERRAINLDPNCGWARGKADVLYVADAFAVMKKVNEMLKAGK